MRRYIKFFLLSFVAFLCIVLVNIIINEHKKKSCIFIDDFTEFAYQIENVEFEEENLVIKGWFFELKKIRNIEPAKSFGNQIGVSIWDVNNDTKQLSDGSIKVDDVIPMTIEYLDRQDVNSYFACEYDYSHCGFVARVKKEQLNLSDNEYQILIKPDKNGIEAIPTQAFICKGKLSRVISKDIINVDFNNTDLFYIVNQGTLLASVPELKLSIYQYDWKLYWIIYDKENYLSNIDDTAVEYMIDTTQFGKLPKERTDNYWFWDNLGSRFSEYDMSEEFNIVGCKVYVRDIPTEYSVTLIDTGCYENEKWIWRRILRPQYNFNE